MTSYLLVEAMTAAVWPHVRTTRLPAARTADYIMLYVPISPICLQVQSTALCGGLQYT